jgi:hypothetical protein
MGLGSLATAWAIMRLRTDYPKDDTMTPAARFRQTSPRILFRCVSRAALALVAACMLLSLPVSAQSDGVIRAPSGVMYVTGGVGSDDVDRLKSMEKDFNVKLVFARTSGDYLSDVNVTVADASGQVVLQVTSRGPLLMAKLPPGSYQIDATFDGQPKKLKVTVAASRLATVDFRWPPG